MSDSYERGLEYAWAQGEAGQAGFGDDWPGDLPQNEGQQLMVDVTMYRLVETKLGSTAHGWETWDGIDQRAEAMKVRRARFFELSLTFPHFNRSNLSPPLSTS